MFYINTKNLHNYVKQNDNNNRYILQIIYENFFFQITENINIFFWEYHSFTKIFII